MSKAIYDLTMESIDRGFHKNDPEVIEKETDYILGKIVTTLVNTFPEKITGIAFDKDGIEFDLNYLLSEKHERNIKKWLQNIVKIDQTLSNTSFGKLKIDLESWYYQIGGGEINFHYPSSYLLTPKKASAHLGVSRVTLNKFIQQGLECVDTTSHQKIPRFAVELWQDPVYAIRMQMIAQDKKLRNQTTFERLEEVNFELTQLEIKYTASTVKEAFAAYNGDSMDDPTDYYQWRDLENEKKEIIQSLGGSRK